MTTDVPRVLAETPASGDPPRMELQEWAKRFGVVAGITVRGGEAGRGFDVGLWGQGPVGEAMTRWRRLRRGFPAFAGLVMAHQVHGVEVLDHAEPLTGWVLHEGADGHLTRHAGTLLAVTVADCTPVYLLDQRTGMLGLLHAGWRGTAGGILRRAMERWQRAHDVRPADVVLHCGVSISGPEYEVGAEVFAACGLAVPATGRGHLDVRAVLARQAALLGIGEVSCSPWCSARDAAHFHSHRRSGGRDGRMLAFLGRPRG